MMEEFRFPSLVFIKRRRLAPVIAPEENRFRPSEKEEKSHGVFIEYVSRLFTYAYGHKIHHRADVLGVSI